MIIEKEIKSVAKFVFELVWLLCLIELDFSSLINAFQRLIVIHTGIKRKGWHFIRL